MASWYELITGRFTWVVDNKPKRSWEPPIVGIRANILRQTSKHHRKCIDVRFKVLSLLSAKNGTKTRNQIQSHHLVPRCSKSGPNFFSPKSQGTWHWKSVKWVIMGNGNAPLLTSSHKNGFKDDLLKRHQWLISTLLNQSFTICPVTNVTEGWNICIFLGHMQMHHRVTEPATFFNGPQHVALAAGSQFFRQNQGAVKRKFVRCAGDWSYGSVSKTTGLVIYTKREWLGKYEIHEIHVQKSGFSLYLLDYLKVIFMISALHNFERPMILNG